MSGFGPPPTGPGYPPPSSYPPGSYPPSEQMGMYPPPGSQPPASSAWKYVLMGCAIVALIGVVSTAAVIYLISQKAPELASMAAQGMKMTKPHYLGMLTEDHTAEQRENFSRHLDLLFEAMGKEGFEEFGKKYNLNFQGLQDISADQEITVEESEEWCEKLDDALDGKPEPEPKEEEF